MSSTAASHMPPPLDLGHLRFADTVELGQAVRSLGAGLHSQQEAAQRLVEYLYASFRDAATGEPHTGLVRCFKTQPLGSLPPAQRAAAAASLPEQDLPETLRCLTLLGTRGERAEWNRPSTSVGHKAIPLPDTAMVERAPMIAALFSQMGVDIDVLVAPPRENFVLEQGTSSYNVFHVEDARGSALIPAQQTFVIPHGIRSVVGMGGRMPNGELFAVILFARVHVSRETAELFRTLALSVKLLLLPFAPSQVFAGEQP